MEKGLKQIDEKLKDDRGTEDRMERKLDKSMVTSKQGIETMM